MIIITGPRASESSGGAAGDVRHRAQGAAGPCGHVGVGVDQERRDVERQGSHAGSLLPAPV